MKKKGQISRERQTHKVHIICIEIYLLSLSFTTGISFQDNNTSWTIFLLYSIFMYSVLQERQYHHTYTVIQGYPTHGIYSSALKEQETAAIATIYYQGFFVFALRLTIIIITTTTRILMRMISNKDKIKNMNTKEFLISIYKKRKSLI